MTFRTWNILGLGITASEARVAELASSRMKEGVVVVVVVEANGSINLLC